MKSWSFIIEGFISWNINKLMFCVLQLLDYGYPFHVREGSFNGEIKPIILYILIWRIESNIAITIGLGTENRECKELWTDINIRYKYNHLGKKYKWCLSGKCCIASPSSPSPSSACHFHWYSNSECNCVYKRSKMEDRFMKPPKALFYATPLSSQLQVPPRALTSAPTKQGIQDSNSSEATRKMHNIMAIILIPLNFTDELWHSLY